MKTLALCALILAACDGCHEYGAPVVPDAPVFDSGCKVNEAITSMRLIVVDGSAEVLPGCDP